MLLRILATLSFSLVTGLSIAQCTNVNTAFSVSQTTFCGPGPHIVSFTNTSTGTAAGTSTYEWQLNGTQFALTAGLLPPLTSSVTAPGTYTYTLIATNLLEPCTESASVQVTVLPTPTAAFSFNPDNACAGTNISFTNTSTGSAGSTTYSWNFGDGNTSTGFSPSHTYAAGGVYNAVLTMTNGAGCTSTVSHTVTVVARPVVSISGDDGDGNLTNCLSPVDPSTSETVVFTNTTTGATSYSWNFGDGNTSTLQSPSHTYLTYGTFPVTMTATSPGGCTTTANLTVIFERFVSASISLDLSQYSGCAPLALTTLLNNSTNASNFVWNFGDGTIINTTNPAPPVHSYTTAGNYTISLVSSNSCNTANTSIGTIVIVDVPNTTFTPSTTLGCAPQSVTFTNSTTGTSPGNNYQWNMGNGNTYTNTTIPPPQVYPIQGVYTITLIAGNACGTRTATRTITIDSIPIAEFSANPLEGCSPLTVTLTNQSVGNGLSYSWSLQSTAFPYNFFSSSSPNIGPFTYTFPPGNVPINRVINLTVSNHCGTRSTAETIIIHPPTDAEFAASATTVCLGQPITFTDQSLGEGLTWNWDFGNGTTATTQGTHTVTYLTPGTYTVTLTATGYCGPDVRTRTIIVNPIPVADFTPSVTSGCRVLSVNFTNNSTVGATSYGWNFGTGAAPATSALYTPPAVTYATAGTKMVVLTVNALGCIARDTAYITVFPTPVPAFTATPASGCSPLTVSFNNTTTNSGTETFGWNFGNGATSAAYAPPPQTYIALNNDSLYTITLVVTTSNGCIDSLKRTITVRRLPVAGFTAASDSICLNQTMSLTNTSVNATSYNWNFGDGLTSTAVSPTHNYAVNGNYTIQLIATSAFGCKDTVAMNVYIDSIPDAQFSNTTVCQGFVTDFTDNSVGIPVSWSWNFGDGSPVSTLQNPQHTYAAAGTYTVTLTVTNVAGCQDVMVHSVIVNAVPVAAIGATTFCLGQTTQFTDLSTGVTVGWEWNFGDASSFSTLKNPTHVYASTGVYNVTLVAFGSAGCSDTIQQTVTITGIPTSDFNVASVCTNDTTFFTDASLGSPDTYSWNFGDASALSALHDPAHVYTTSGTYSVTLVTSFLASGCSNSITKSVTAFPRTQPHFTANTPCLGGVTGFVDATTNNPTSWNWDFDDSGATSTVQNPAHTYNAPGFYDIQLITENVFGCVDTLHQTIQVYPLPVADFSFDIVCLGQNTAIGDLSTGASNWQYSWGDGNSTSGLSSPSYNYAIADTFTVTQVVTTTVGCTDTIMKQIIVRPNPVSDFAIDTVCFSYANAFTDLSTNAVGWNWNFGDGPSTSTSQNTTHVYSTDGTFTTTLTVTNVFGCTDQSSQSILVLPQPTAGFSNTTVCAGNGVIFTDTSYGMPVAYSWNFGDGSAIVTDQNPEHTYATGGSYTITMIAGNPVGCADTLIKTISVFTVPQVDFTADTVCLFNITHFSNLTTDGTPISSYQWDFGDGNTSYQQHPTYIYQDPGIFNVSLYVVNASGCDSTYIQQVVVSPFPVAAFSIDTACLGTPTTFTDLSTGLPTEWIWDFGDGTIINGGPTEQHTYLTPGNYLVSMIVSGGGAGCSDQIYHIVTVNEVPIAGGILPSSVCQDAGLNFTDNSSMVSGSIVSHSWNMGDGTIYTTANGTHTYNAPGTYPVILSIVSNSGCTDQFTATISVFGLPDATIVSANQELCPGESIELSTTAGLSYQWTGPNGFSSDQPAVTITGVTAINSGTYYLTVSDANSCKQSDSSEIVVLSGADCIHITQLVTLNGDGINDSWIIEGIEQYPNVEVFLFNRWGNLIYTNKAYQNDWYGEVNQGMAKNDSGRVPPGTYFYVVRLHDGATQDFEGYIEVQY